MRRIAPVSKQRVHLRFRNKVTGEGVERILLNSDRVSFPAIAARHHDSIPKTTLTPDEVLLPDLLPDGRQSAGTQRTLFCFTASRCRSCSSRKARFALQSQSFSLVIIPWL